MRAIIDERQLTEEQQVQLELEELAPEKFDADLQFKVNKEQSNVKKNNPRYTTLTRAETARLIAASNAPFENPEPRSLNVDYPTYTREQVEFLMRDYFGYKNKEEEKRKWDSLKTTESEVKTNTKTKRSTSTRD